MEIQTTQQEIFIKMVLSAWESQNDNFNKLLEALSDEQLSKKIAPGKNTGIYLLGHLIAVSDGMLPLLGAGEKLFPELETVFIRNPDSPEVNKYTIAGLKENLKAINAKLATFISSITTSGWFERHTAVSAEDFKKEPHRNKLNIIINRSSHMAYHVGQMVLLK